MKRDMEDLSPPRRAPSSEESVAPSRIPLSDASRNLSPPRRRRPSIEQTEAEPSLQGDLSPPRRRASRPSSSRSRSPSSRDTRHLSRRDEDHHRHHHHRTHHQHRDHARRHGDYDPRASSSSRHEPSHASSSRSSTHHHHPSQERHHSQQADLKGAQETIVRDRSGRKIDEVEEAARRATEAAASEARLQEAQRWGRGVAQVERSTLVQKALEDVRAEPFARHKTDVKLNAAQAAETRWEDPMKHLAEERLDLHGADALAGVGTVKRVKRCPFHAPPNRYGIQPGPMWDGVDRSNGFELKYLAARNKQQMNARLAYKYGSADM